MSANTSGELTAAQRAYLQRVIRSVVRQGGTLEPETDRFEIHHIRAVDSMPELDASADAALERLGRGLSSTTELGFLEALVRRDRPVFDIQDGTFPRLEAPWDDFEAHRKTLEHAVGCIGRIDLIGHPSLEYGGTGVLVGPRTVMTNRHVAELFTQGLGERVTFSSSGVRARFDTRHELGRPAGEPPLEIVEPLLIHPYWDIALLRVRGGEDRHFLPLLGEAPAALDGRRIAVVGYPAFDQRNDVGRQMETFRGVFGYKRLAVGTVMGRERIRSYRRNINAVTHDASTLGGNSGSAVIDLETGKLLGVHFAGLYLEANFAVPAWELGLDPKVTGRDVRIEPIPIVGAQPSAEQVEAWRELEPGEAAASPEPLGTISVAAGGRREEALSPFEWYERQDDASLAEALRNAPEITQERLVAALGAEEAAEVVDLLLLPTEEGIFDPEPDPGLPEIVLLHGIMGAHLEHRGASTLRVWLSALSLLFRDVPARLALSADGVTDARRDEVLVPGPHLELAYGRAVRRLRRARFVVHPVSYDWRKGIEAAADRLHLDLERLALDRPNRRFMLVAHSMGGLVAACYARRYPAWSTRVQRAVFAGTPLGGSYAPLEAIRGTYPLFEKLVWVTSPGDEHAATRRAFCLAAATMPGLVDMLPNPALFPDADPFYMQASWGPAVAPRQWLLDQSRSLKRAFVESPILDRTTLLVSLDHGTVTSVLPGSMDAGPRTGAGDGTVPARAAAIQGVPAYRATFEHSELLREPAVIQAVIDLAKTGACALPRVMEADLGGAGPRAVLEAVAAPAVVEEATALAVRERARRGELRGEDVRWLLSAQRGA